MNVQKAESERVKALVGIFAEYAQKVPAEKADWKPEGGAKSAKELLEHIAASNQGFAAIIQGKDLGIQMDKSERANVSIEAQNLPEAIEALKASGEALAGAISTLPDDQLGQNRTMPWGEEWQMSRLLATASAHISYHWGQLAYLQTMWGDKNDYM